MIMFSPEEQTSSSSQQPALMIWFNRFQCYIWYFCLFYISRGFKKAASSWQPEQKKVRQQINILDFRGQYRHLNVFKCNKNLSANSSLITTWTHEVCRLRYFYTYIYIRTSSRKSFSLRWNKEQKIHQIWKTIITGIIITLNYYYFLWFLFLSISIDQLVCLCQHSFKGSAATLWWNMVFM